MDKQWDFFVYSEKCAINWKYLNRRFLHLRLFWMVAISGMDSNWNWLDKRKDDCKCPDKKSQMKRTISSSV